MLSRLARPLLRGGVAPFMAGRVVMLSQPLSRRGFYSEAAGAGSKESSAPPPPPPPGSDAPAPLFSWRKLLLQPRALLLMVMGGLGLGLLYAVPWVSGVWGRYQAGVAENNSVSALELEGHDPVQLTMLFLHTKIARVVMVSLSR